MNYDDPRAEMLARAVREGHAALVKTDIIARLQLIASLQEFLNETGRDLADALKMLKEIENAGEP